MKHLLRAAAINLFAAAIALLPMTVSAEDHAAHHPPAAQMPSTKESSSSMPTMEMEKMGMDNMKEMQEQMAAIHAAKDSKERTKLMDEHMQSMQDMMKMMHAKGGCEMKHEGMMMKHADASTEAHEHSEHHQCMMEQMMEQMMQHMQAMKDG
jgi:hypothetical protein